MKSKITLLTLIAVLTLVSCESKLNPPVISNVEIGIDNSQMAYLGGDLHLEAEIIAEAKIDRIVLTIHPESEGEHVDAMKTVSILQSEEWEVDSIYTGKYSGVLNTTFHEHISVPTTAVAGDYHLHLQVIDMEGNTSEIESELVLDFPVVN